MMSEKEVREMVDNLVKKYDENVCVFGIHQGDWNKIKEVLRALKVQVFLGFSKINKKTKENDVFKQRIAELEKARERTFVVPKSLIESIIREKEVKD